MRYIWDDRKNTANIRKHGIAFEDAIRVFESRMFVWPDERFHYDEERWVASGIAEGHEIVVVYVETDEERRIISARPATRREREIYWQHGG